MNKKKGLLSLFATLLLVKLIPYISAQSWGYFDFNQGAYNLVYGIQSILGPLFEAILGVSQFDQYFFARVLFLIVTYVVVSMILETVDLFKGKPGVIFIVSAVVSILGARYIASMDLIENILLPYGAVTIAIATILPFIIIFFFIHRTINNGAGRMLAWIFFALIFIGLWLTRRAYTEYDWIYNLGIWVILAVIIFDRRIHNYFGLLEIRKAKNEQIDYMLAQLEADLNKLNAITNPSQTTKNTIERLERRRLELINKKH